MSKNIVYTLLLFVLSTFASCGGSDITPPNDQKPDEPGTKPTSPIAQMVGQKTGIVEIKLAGAENTFPEVADVLVYMNEEMNGLHFSFNRPNIVVGGTYTTDIKQIDNVFKLALKNYKPIVTTLEGENIPSYIRKMFPQFTLTKVELGTFRCEKGGVYDINSKVLSMTFITDMSVYYVGADTPLSGLKLEFDYPSLINGN